MIIQRKTGTSKLATSTMLLLGGVLLGGSMSEASQGQNGGEQHLFHGEADFNALGKAELATYLSDRQYVQGLVTPGTNVSLNYADPRQYRFVMTRLRLAGKTRENSPQLFKKLALKREQDLKANLRQGSVISVSSTSGYTYQHHIFSNNTLPSMTGFEGAVTCTYPGGAFYTWCDVSVWDGAGNLVGPSRYGEGFSAARVDVSTTGTFNGSRRYVVDTYSIMDADTGLIDSYDTGLKDPELYFIKPGDSGAPAITAPKDRPNDTDDYISICLNRTWTQDCDYDLTGTYWAVKMPLAGALRINDAQWGTNVATRFKFNQAQINTWKQFGGGGFIKLTLATTGGGCDALSVAGKRMSEFWGNVVLLDGGRTLSWNMTDDKSLFFDEGCRRVQNEVYLTMYLNLPLIQGDDPNKITTIPTYLSNQTTGLPATPFYVFDKIKMTNSCLAAGTGIKMADGALLPIESVKIGDRVANPYHHDTQALTVVDVAKGFEVVPMVRIEDEAGSSLLLTEMHPVYTVERGMVLAKYLQVGNQVLNGKGPSRLVRVAREKFDGQVYNLKVGNPEEARALAEDQTVVFANGILVGDGQIQSRYEHKELTSNARADVLRQLPAHWKQDYLNRLGR